MDLLDGFPNEVRITADLANLINDEPLDLSGRDRWGRAIVPTPFLCVAADVIAVPLVPAFCRVCWYHRGIAAYAPQPSLQQGTKLVPHRGPAGAAVTLQLRLHPLPKVWIDDCGVFTVMDLVLVSHLAKVRDVGQQFV